MEDKSVIDSQIRALEDDDPHVFFDAIDKLVKNENHDFVLESLLASIRDKSKTSQLREHAAFALAHMACPRPSEPFYAPVIPHVIEALKDQDTQLRRWIINGIGGIEFHKTIPSDLVQPLSMLVGDPDWHIRGWAVTALGYARDPSVVESLITKLNDPIWDVRRRAVLALGEIKDPRAIDPIKELAAKEKDNGKWILGRVSEDFGLKTIPSTPVKPVVQPTRVMEPKPSGEEARTSMRDGVAEFAPCPQCGSTNVKKIRYTLWGGFLTPSLFHLVKCNDCGKTYNGKTGGKKNRPIHPEAASAIKTATLPRSQIPASQAALPGQPAFHPEVTETDQGAREQEYLALLRLRHLHAELAKAKSEAEAQSRRWGKPVLQGCLVSLVIIMVGLLFSLSIPADTSSSSFMHTLNNIGMLLLIAGGFYLVFRREKQKTAAWVFKADAALQAAVKEVSQQLPSMLEQLGGAAALLDQGRVEDALSLREPQVKRNAAPMPVRQPAVPKEEKWDAPEGVSRLLREHIARLSRLFQGRLGEQENLRSIQRVVADDLLTYAIDQISQKMPESLAEKKAIHTTGELGEWFIAITVCPWLKPEEVKAHLGQGYMELLDALTRSALNMPGGKNIAHWIYCSDGSQAAAHLTLIPNPQGTYKGAVVLAQDLLSPQERQQAGLPPISGQGVSSFVKPTSKPVPGMCFQCHKPLKAMAGGVYAGASMMAAMEQIPYPCKSCGTHFCVKCMAKIKQENNSICPYCKQNNGW